MHIDIVWTETWPRLP